MHMSLKALIFEVKTIAHYYNVGSFVPVLHHPVGDNPWVGTSPVITRGWGHHGDNPWVGTSPVITRGWGHHR